MSVPGSLHFLRGIVYSLTFVLIKENKTIQFNLYAFVIVPIPLPGQSYNSFLHYMYLSFSK